MTVSLCIRQESKRNDDSVIVEELDCSAERQVLIPAEHLWCDFKYRPWDKNSSPNTNDLYIHYMDKSTGTPPSLEEKRALPNCQQRWKHNIKNDHFCCIIFEVYEMPVPICHWCFFHTDWIIISLWTLSYTQRHCHVRIEKFSVQTFALKLEAHNSLEYHYMLKH